jgi:hypothetical protein
VPQLNRNIILINSKLTVHFSHFLPTATAFGTPFGVTATTASTGFGGFGTSFGSTAQQPSTGFGSTFGAQSSTTPAFGSTFGTPASSTPAFGTSFGAPASTSAPTFGTGFGASGVPASSVPPQRSLIYSVLRPPRLLCSPHPPIPDQVYSVVRRRRKPQLYLVISPRPPLVYLEQEVLQHRACSGRRQHQHRIYLDRASAVQPPRLGQACSVEAAPAVQALDCSEVVPRLARHLCLEGLETLQLRVVSEGLGLRQGEQVVLVHNPLVEACLEAVLEQNFH